MGYVRNIDKELDQIYDLADELMWRGKWNVLSLILEYITENSWKYDSTILCGWATATLAGRDKIVKRVEFMKKCRELFPDEELWRGLD